MDLTHRFSVPAGMDEAWDAFNNLEILAPCFPGATISSVEGDDFTGSVKIKLGPIALVYSGSGRYVERNDQDRRVVIEARGKEKRGNGTATATVTAQFAGDGQQTEVEVFTDLTITGKPAQFGRGVISDVSDRLLEQFVTCVSDRFSQRLAAAEEATPRETAAAVGAETGVDESDSEQTIELEAVPSAGEAAATARVADITPPPTEPAAPTAPRVSEPPRYTPDQGDKGESTLNVLSTVGPVLLKRYGPALAVFALLVFIVIKIIRRKS
jgi:carbon monoxide dehydrogenase subunit G